MPEQQGAPIPNAYVAIVLMDLLEGLSENTTVSFIYCVYDYCENSNCFQYDFDFKVSKTNHIWTNVKVVPSGADVNITLDRLSQSLREVEMIKILKKNRISVTIEHDLSRDLTDLVL